MHPLSRLLVALPVLTVAFATPGVASAAIVPGKSIGKASVGQTASALRRALGTPSEAACNQERSGARRYSACSMSWKRKKLDVHLINNRAVRIGTTDPRQLTRSAIGVGDRRASLDAAYRTCKDPNRTYCILGRTTRTGDAYTYFQLAGASRNARITRISVGRWDPRFECALGCG